MLGPGVTPNPRPYGGPPVPTAPSHFHCRHQNPRNDGFPTVEPRPRAGGAHPRGTAATIESHLLWAASDGSDPCSTECPPNTQVEGRPSILPSQPSGKRSGSCELAHQHRVLPSD